jgi:hypothetical protein
MGLASSGLSQKPSRATCFSMSASRFSLAAMSKIILEIFDANVEFLQALFEFLGHGDFLHPESAPVPTSLRGTGVDRYFVAH